eukprot:Sro387_g132100.2  (307) ;mRNA; f:37183-38204
MEREGLVYKALEVYRNIPEWGETYLSREECLIAVGMNANDAGSEAARKQFDRRRTGMEQRYGRPELPDTIEANTKRAVFLWQRIVEIPSTGRKLTQAYAMELAGFSKENRKAGAQYMKVSRAIKTFQKKQAQQTAPVDDVPPENPVPAAPAPAARVPTAAAVRPTGRVPTAAASRFTGPVLEVEFDDSSDALLSPISAIEEPNAAVVTFDEDKEEASFFNTPPNFHNTQMNLLFDEVYCGNSLSTAPTTKPSNSSIKSNVEWKGARKPQGSVRINLQGSYRDLQRGSVERKYAVDFQVCRSRRNNV